MNSTTRIPDTLPDALPCATGVDFTADSLVVQLEDGRTVSVPLEWFPSLRQANDAQRRNWSFIGGGVGIHWSDLDEDLSVRGLLTPSQAGRFRDAG